MPFRPSWAAPYSSSVTEIVLYCLDCDLFETYLILDLDSLFLEMVVDSFDNRELSALACHSCSNVGFLDFFDDSISHSEALQCMHAALLEAWRVYPDSSARARSKALELHLELAWG